MIWCFSFESKIHRAGICLLELIFASDCCFHVTGFCLKSVIYEAERKQTKNQVSLPGPEGPSQSASSVCFICNVQGFQSYLGGGIRKSMYTLSSQKCSDFFFNLAELISLVASEFSDIFNKAFFMPKSLRIHSWFLLELTIFFTFKIIHLASSLRLSSFM